MSAPAPGITREQIEEWREYWIKFDYPDDEPGDIDNRRQLNAIADLALQALRGLGAAQEPQFVVNQGMKCVACGEPMPSAMTWAANSYAPMSITRCKCGSEQFHGTFTTGLAAPHQSAPPVMDTPEPSGIDGICQSARPTPESAVPIIDHGTYGHSFEEATYCKECHDTLWPLAPAPHRAGQEPVADAQSLWAFMRQYMPFDHKAKGQLSISFECFEAALSSHKLALQLAAPRSFADGVEAAAKHFDGKPDTFIYRSEVAAAIRRLAQPQEEPKS